MNIPKVLGIAFFKEQLRWAAFELSFSIKKEFKKKKASGEIAFALISLVLV